MVRLRGPVVGLVDRIDRRRWWVAAGLVGVGLGAAWWLALMSGSLTAVSRHWFYVPVVFAAVRFGLPGALTAGVLAGLLGGPAVFTVEGATTAFDVWATRGAFFVGVGLFVAGLVAVMRDSQRQTVAVAEQEKRLAYQRSALIQTVSHEFRTPLTILHGGIQTLDRRQDEVAERLRPLIASLVRAERRLDEMVSVVLATADAMDASQRLTAEPVWVAGLVDAVTASLDRPDATRRVVTEIGSHAELIVTVPAYLQLALRCVIDNALRFSPADRPVTVTATRTADATVVIGVHDEGPGIDAGFLEEAFQPFTQADPSSQRAHGGLGIGLFTARRIIERLGGVIRIDPADRDVGTSVVIVVPQQRDGDPGGRLRRRTGGPSWMLGHTRSGPATSVARSDTAD